VRNLVVISAALLCFVFGELSYAATQTLKAEVNGLVCAFCAQGIEKKAKALPQTKEVYVNLEKRIVAVEIKEGQTLAPETLKSLIRDAGYEVVKIDSVTQTAQEIKSGTIK
jgi:cation transport ATPase